MMKPGAILLMGLPGAGKGTQAFRLAKQFPNFVHFDTGGEIHRRVTDPHFADDPLVKEQEKIYFAGDLNTKEWVAGLVLERIRFYSGKNQGVIFSGSPRTLYEAEAVLRLLIECYGREQILVLEVIVSPETARKRSTTRIICANDACRYPVTQEKAGTPCPNCGQTLPGPRMQAKEQWKVDKMPTRIKEFEERTRPAMGFLQKEVAYVSVDGEKSEEEVFAQILSAVKKNLE
jgi:adenylate kinase